MVLTSMSESVPIVDGKMQLGTWQGIFLFFCSSTAGPRIAVTSRSPLSASNFSSGSSAPPARIAGCVL